VSAAYAIRARVSIDYAIRARVSIDYTSVLGSADYAIRARVSIDYASVLGSADYAIRARVSIDCVADYLRCFVVCITGIGGILDYAAEADVEQVRFSFL
jgi:hypothetical protein